jgi:hypothetical protein
MDIKSSRTKFPLREVPNGSLSIPREEVIAKAKEYEAGLRSVGRKAEALAVAHALRLILPNLVAVKRTRTRSKPLAALLLKPLEPVAGQARSSWVLPSRQ